MISHRKETLSGWGNYPLEESQVYRPERINEINEILMTGIHKNYISRGLGRSYGDTALNLQSGVILHTRFNRLISFEEESGLLECESGVSLDDIIQCFLPKGYFLPVTPGTKYVTLGGAIANDVHGKNHHKDGCISDHIVDFKLLIASGQIITCSKDENSDIYWATIGGIGLTGVILTVKIKLIRVQTGYINVDYHRVDNIDAALEMFHSTDDQYQYSVAWIDCLASGKSLGRSILMRGNHTTLNNLHHSIHPLQIPAKRKITVPFNLPSFTLNQLSINAFNTLYYNSYKSYSSKIVSYDSFFYPLDSILHWNRLYGRKGFVQYQVAFPPNTSREGLIALLERLSQSNRSSFLAVLKSFGKKNKGILSFPFSGYTLALDIPINNSVLFTFLRGLDELILKFGGRIYLAKDSELSSEHFQIMYPRLFEFISIKRNIDPNNLFSSSIARRLGIMEENI